jgi:gluconolactonase
VLTSCNFPVLDDAGNIFCSHSTFAPSWPHALDRRTDGFVFVCRPDGTTEVLAEGLRFANGMALNAAQTHLFVTQTSNADVLRYPILPGPKLGPPVQYGPKLGLVAGIKMNPKLQLPGFLTQFLGYTDGLGFDVEGNLYVTLPAAHKIVAITPAGKKVTIAHDPSGRLLQSPTNIAWGGPNRETMLIASLSAPYILAAAAPVAGQKLAFQ